MANLIVWPDMTKYEVRAKRNLDEGNFPIIFSPYPSCIKKGVGVYDTSPADDDTNLSAFPTDKKMMEMRCSTMAWAHWLRYTHAVKLVRNGSSVLDLGSGKCYIGRFLYQALKKPIYVAMDLNSRRLREGINMGFGYEKYIFLQKDISKHLPFLSESFDYVFSYESLEHINEKSGKNMIKEVYRVLKKDGIFSVATPNFQGQKVSEKYEKYKTSGKGDYKVHPYEWNFFDLFRFLSRNKFLVLSHYGNDIVDDVRNLDKYYEGEKLYKKIRDFLPSSLVRAMASFAVEPKMASFITIDARKT